MCEDLHDRARDAFILWKDNKRPRYGPIYQIMKNTRAQFKLILRKCKNKDLASTSDSLANKLLSKDTKSFWREIKKVKSTSSPVASTIGGATGSRNITEMWRSHFKEILNSCNDFKDKPCVSCVVNKPEALSFCRITPDEVSEVAKTLKLGKAAGLDNLTNEHFRYCHESMYVLLSLLFNSMLIHNHLPATLMNTIISPIIKDKKSSITDKDNYRPIAITCVTSKILELLILKRCKQYLLTSDNQFGFKKRHSTDICVFVLKQVLDYFLCSSTPVYICFLDASKAFDKINHWTLFSKLIKRNMPSIFVRLLATWYSTQTFVVQYNN